MYGLQFSYNLIRSGNEGNDGNDEERTLSLSWQNRCNESDERKRLDKPASLEKNVIVQYAIDDEVFIRGL